MLTQTLLSENVDKRPITDEQKSWLKKVVLTDLEELYLDSRGKICCDNEIEFFNFHDKRHTIPDYIRFGKVDTVTFTPSVEISKPNYLFPEEVHEIMMRNSGAGLGDFDIPPLAGLSKFTKKLDVLYLTSKFKSGALEFYKAKVKTLSVPVPKAGNRDDPRIKHLHDMRRMKKLFETLDVFDFQEQMIELGLERLL